MIDKHGYVYIMKHQDKYKIGRTKELTRRLYQYKFEIEP